MPASWDPSHPPPRPVPWGFFLDRLWMDLMRVLALFLVVVLIAWVRADFNIRELDLVSRIGLPVVGGLLALYLLYQGWMGRRLMRRGVCVEAEVLKIRPHGKDDGMFCVHLRWDQGGREVERERYYPNDKHWRPWIEELQKTQRLVMLVDPKHPSWGLPLHNYTDPRPRSLRAVFFGR